MRKEATKHTTESASSVGTQTRKKPYEKPRLAQFGRFGPNGGEQGVLHFGVKRGADSEKARLAGRVGPDAELVREALLLDDGFDEA